MAASSSLQLTLQFGICRRNKRFRNSKTRGKLCLLGSDLSSVSPFQRQYSWNTNLSKRIHRRVCTIPSRNHQFKCHCFLKPGSSLDVTSLKNAALTLARSCNHLLGNPLVIKLAPAVSIVVFAIWGLRPLVRQIRTIFLHKSDSSWKKSSTYHVTTSYVQPLLLWTGVIFICRALDPIILPSETGQIVKRRLLHFIKSLSTVLAFAFCLSSVIQQAQKFLMETNDPTVTTNMGFQFAGRAVYSAVWVAAAALFMELLGFSTQKWITAGGLGTVLLTLAGREILTNFLSSVMIHATRPFVLNEWIQTNIQGYEVSGTVEQVGWWAQTIVRGDDREAVHIPNHKFTVNVVRNLSQKTHWRIKTHLAISHLDVAKINYIVADMRKVLAKNPHVEQQKLHRRVFLDNINPENQALLILVSCFVKTSRFEEYLCVKEAVLQDLLRVIRHHRARLATPIRTVQKISRDVDFDTIPYADTIFNQQGPTSKHHPEVLLPEHSYKINGDDTTKPQAAPKATTANAKSTTPDNNNKIDATKADSSVSSTSSQLKQAPPLEENIVLGVALDGSKRTLPIEEEDMVAPPNNNNNNPDHDVKGLAGIRSSGNDKEKSDVKGSDGPGSPGGGQLDQQD